MLRFPEWFAKWSDKNPKDIYGPGILVGAVGGAVFVAALIITWGYPAPVESAQTGPRGTGMSVTKFASDNAAPDPGIAEFLASTSAPVTPGEDAQRAGDVYPDAEPLLADLSVENYDRLLAAMREWTGIPDLLEDPEHYQSVVARRMIQMTQFINEEWDAHVGPSGVTCATCHRGEAVPSNVWFELAPVLKATAGWSAIQNRATPNSSFTSLPSDALEKFLVEANAINVHDLEPRVSRADANPATWQNTERTYALMNYFSNSLGVNCVFCHNTAAFYDAAQVTPQWGTANLGIFMVRDINNEYLVPLRDTYPAERLGPVNADAPKAACATCHKGYSKPYQGLEVIADWPELATTGAPVYPAAQ